MLPGHFKSGKLWLHTVHTPPRLEGQNSGVQDTTLMSLFLKLLHTCRMLITQRILGPLGSLSLLHRNCSQATSALPGWERVGVCQFMYRNLHLAKLNSIVLSAMSGLLFNLPVFKAVYTLGSPSDLFLKTLMAKPHPRKIELTLWKVLWVSDFICYVP